MKIYNYISMLFLAGTAMLASCTQNEELGEETDTLNGFQISVSDNGFQDPTGTRAAENNFATKFADGDAIGVFGVKGTSVVSDIENRKFTLNNGVWELDGKAIEYKSSEFRGMEFYAYYPYNENVKFNATSDDPFATYVSEWEIGNDQSETNYTQYDLMTSSGKAEGERLKGKISFVMEHRMAVVVMKKPTVTYDFTNEGVADYILTTDFNSFNLQGKPATPYYQKSTDTYRFLVKPGEKYEIKTSYTGVEDKEMECVMSFPDGLNKGIAKVYTIADKNKYTQELAVGDYLCADGKIVSKAATAPNNAIGIVFYVGNPQPSVTHPDKYSIDKDPLRRDYPECKHGLVLALKNALLGTEEKGRFNTSNKHYYGTWFRTDEKYKNSYVDTERGKNVAPIAGFQGYNNTVLMEVSATMGDDYKAGAGNALTALETYRTENTTPTTTTGWYFPSDFDLITVKQVVATVNSSIDKANGTVLVINDGATEGGSFYWSNTERNNEWLWVNTMGSGSDASGPAESGSLTAKRYASKNDGFFRMMLAF